MLGHALRRAAVQVPEGSTLGGVNSGQSLDATSDPELGAAAGAGAGAEAEVEEEKDNHPGRSSDLWVGKLTSALAASCVLC